MKLSSRTCRTAGFVMSFVAMAFLLACSSDDTPMIQDASLVFRYLPRGADSSVTFEAGAYKGGTAVLGEQGEAFWIKDGKAYTANDAAKGAAPDLPQAPPDVDPAELAQAARQGGS